MIYHACSVTKSIPGEYGNHLGGTAGLAAPLHLAARRLGISPALAQFRTLVTDSVAAQHE